MFFLSRFSFFLFLTSCVFESGKQNLVEIRVLPYGQGEGRFSRSPIIYRSSGNGKKVCRNYPYSHSKAREALSSPQSITNPTSRPQVALSKEFLDILFGEEQKEGEGTINRSDDLNPRGLSQSSAAQEASVEDYWLELGLFIKNNSKYHLLIEKIVYSALSYCGVFASKDEPFFVSGEVTPEFCQGEGGEIPNFLYFVRSGGIIQYKPYSQNIFENLKIYLDAFNGIDRTNDKNRLTKNEVSIQEQNKESRCKPTKLIAIPDYTVELVFIGTFISAKGNTIGEFVQKINFNTRSSTDLIAQ